MMRKKQFQKVAKQNILQKHKYNKVDLDITLY